MNSLMIALIMAVNGATTEVVVNPTVDEHIYIMMFRRWDHSEWNTEDKVKQVIREMRYLGKDKLWEADGCLNVPVVLKRGEEDIKKLDDIFYVEEYMLNNFSDKSGVKMSVSIGASFMIRDLKLSGFEKIKAEEAYKAGNWFSNKEEAISRFLIKHPEYKGAHDRGESIDDYMLQSNYFWGSLPHDVVRESHHLDDQPVIKNYHLDIVGSVLAALTALGVYIWAEKKYKIM